MNLGSRQECQTDQGNYSVKDVLSVVCFSLHQLKKRKGTWLSVLVFSMSAGDTSVAWQ